MRGSQEIAGGPCVLTDPTAQTLSADVAVTACSALGPPDCAGTITCDQVAPFQWSASGIDGEVKSAAHEPTAQTSVDERAVTANRIPRVNDGGVDMLHAAPFQCSINGWFGPAVVEAVYPTAQASSGATLATPKNKLSTPEAGVATTLH
jgi:hypothetical protein